MIVAQCPHCKHHIRCDDRYAGRAVACPKCKKPFQMPAAEAAAELLGNPELADDAWSSPVQGHDSLEFLSTVEKADSEPALTNRYHALRLIARFVKVLTVATIVLIWLITLVWWISLVSITKTDISFGWVVGEFVCAVFSSIIIWLAGFAQAELILLAIDVSNDMRINCTLLKAIRCNTMK